MRNLDTFVRSYLKRFRTAGTITPEVETMAQAALRASPPRVPTEASERQDYTTAYRLLSQALLLLAGDAWTNEIEFASAFDFQVFKSIVIAGEPLRFEIQPWFTAAWTPRESFTARLELRTMQGQQVDARTVAIKEYTPYTGSFSTAKLRPGRYLLHYELIGAAGKPLTSADRDFQVSSNAHQRVRALKEKLPQFAQLTHRGISFRTAVETIEYIATTVQRARTQYAADRWKQSHPFLHRLIRGSPIDTIGSDPFHLERDLTLAEHLADALLHEMDPFRNRIGDMHLAYRSAIDGTLQPFRLFIPDGFNPTRRYPLIVALHGGGLDENAYMDMDKLGGSPRSSRNLFKELGQERGYFLLAPKGRDPSSRYMGIAEQDVLDVLGLVQQLYPVNRREIFLTGVSMGGNGTWSIGFKHAGRFAALAPVAASFRGNLAEFEALPLGRASEMPVLFAYALKDNTAAPEDARRIAAHAKKVFTNFQAQEYPEDTHFSIAVSSMPSIFDFFDEQRKRRSGNGSTQ